jgi:uncharacterized protein (TIGR01777 family)
MPSVAISGATGFIGTPLVARLRAAGWTVRRLLRTKTGATPDDLVWDPARGVLDAASLDGIDAAINLSGATIAQRWSTAHKREIRESRLATTTLLARTLASLAKKPSVFISQSAIGIYGLRGDEPLAESASLGEGFLASISSEWEAADVPARAAGIRVVHTRSGLVLNHRGGALERLLPIFNVGAGGKAGDGKQWMSWISMTDIVRAFEFLLGATAISGAVNVTAPEPVTNADFARTLGHVLHRPAVATAPELMIKLMFGEMGEETLLKGQRVIPRRLMEAGFTFEHPTLTKALEAEVR